MLYRAERPKLIKSKLRLKDTDWWFLFPHCFLILNYQQFILPIEMRWSKTTNRFIFCKPLLIIIFILLFNHKVQHTISKVLMLYTTISNSDYINDKTKIIYTSPLPSSSSSSFTSDLDLSDSSSSSASLPSAYIPFE